MLLAWGMELENATQIIYTADAMQCSVPRWYLGHHGCVRLEHCICSVEAKYLQKKPAKDSSQNSDISDLFRVKKDK